MCVEGVSSHQIAQTRIIDRRTGVDISDLRTTVLFPSSRTANCPKSLMAANDHWTTTIEILDKMLPSKPSQDRIYLPNPPLTIHRLSPTNPNTRSQDNVNTDRLTNLPPSNNDIQATNPHLPGPRHPRLDNPHRHPPLPNRQRKRRLRQPTQRRYTLLAPHATPNHQLVQELRPCPAVSEVECRRRSE